MRRAQNYDWTQLHDRSRLDRARRTREPQLLASIDRLEALLEGAPAC